MRKLLLFAVAAFIVSCEWRGTPPSRTLEDDISDLLNAGKCEEALSVLARNEQRNEPAWYQLRADAAAECFTRTHDDKYRSLVLQTLADGRAAFPRSSRMLAWTGYMNERLGDQAAAEEAFKAAVRVATENERACEACRETAEDRNVLRELRENKRPSS